ncbi:hypothetical protein KAH85_00835 [Candidatus Bathyarchaeota archaeon]|nr:hypothetical protein [Candidatus Bathyarchaeota archaeon]MCK5631083.1 hypothetical protein [Candidatus Bathyarchaeota archaeon]
MSNGENSLLFLGLLMCLLAAISMISDVLGDRTIPGAIVLGALGTALIVFSRRQKR